jgi:hypothetical protein
MSPTVYRHHLQSRLAGYPSDVQAAAERKRAAIQRSMPRLKRRQPLMLASTFTTARDWWTIEVLVLKLAAAPIGPMRRWGDVIPFTTLALDYRDESNVVAVPANHTVHLDGVPIMDIG